MNTEPAFTFELPSLEDSTVLNARIYHPESLQEHLLAESGDALRLRGAIIAHPYAPLGGSYDDHVVLSVADTLLERGFVVATFNFRGSGDSQGKTSWTGQGELDDYTSIVGCLVQYLQNLATMRSDSETIGVLNDLGPTEPSSTGSEKPTTIDLVLAGYSYGSLILARMPPPCTIMNRFEDAVIGTAAAEIILRARTLARQTKQSVLATIQRLNSPRGDKPRQGDPPASANTAGRARASTVTVGGEETNLSHRHRSDSRRSNDIVRRSIEAPARIVAHVRRRSGSRGHSKTPSEPVVPVAVVRKFTSPRLQVRYLLISPVVLPFTNLLLPPGPALPSLNLRHTTDESRVRSQFLHHPTLAVFGSADSFTNSRRLSGWAKKQAAESSSEDFKWEMIKGAGHFWREQGELRALHETIDRWIQSASA